jgi:putative oxidoreductase
VPFFALPTAAYLGTIDEHLLPVLLLFGLASRLSARGLSLLALIIARGPGAISLDHLIWNGRMFIPAIAHRAQA